MKRGRNARAHRGKKHRRPVKAGPAAPGRQKIGGAAGRDGARFAAGAGGGGAGAASAAHADPERFSRDALRIRLDEAILDPKRLRAETGQDPIAFFYAVAILKNMMRDDAGAPAPLPPGGIDARTAPRADSGCEMRAEHMLHMFLYQLRTGNLEQAAASRYGINRAAAGRRLWAIRRMLGTPGALPTPRTLAGELWAEA